MRSASPRHGRCTDYRRFAGPCGIWAGAPRTQLAFVGAPGTDFEAIDAALDACLLGDRELALYDMTPDDEQRGWNFPVPESLLSDYS